MKTLFAAAAASALLLAAGAASAAEVSVTVGPELQKLSRAYGAKEIETLRQDLASSVQHALDRAGPTAPQRVDLVLEAATPNRPTFNELTAFPGLSMTSIGLGGAAITGTVTGADGAARPVSFRRYETDIHEVVGYGTWTDADIAFDDLASQLAKGKTPDAGPYRPDLARNAAFDSLNRLR